MEFSAAGCTLCRLISGQRLFRTARQQLAALPIFQGEAVDGACLKKCDHIYLSRQHTECFRAWLQQRHRVGH